MQPIPKEFIETCSACGESFYKRSAMQKFCSPQCRNDWYEKERARTQVVTLSARLKAAQAKLDGKRERPKLEG